MSMVSFSTVSNSQIKHLEFFWQTCGDGYVKPQYVVVFLRYDTKIKYLNGDSKRISPHCAGEKFLWFFFVKLYSNGSLIPTRIVLPRILHSLVQLLFSPDLSD